MTTQTEAMKLALEALEVATTPLARDRQEVLRAQAALREALAEQPAQQEPVATEWERVARAQNAKLMAMCNQPGGMDKLREVLLAASPQAQPAPEIAIADAYRAGVDSGIAAEREACAMACEAHKINGQLVHSNAVVGCAAAIRARGNT